MNNKSVRITTPEIAKERGTAPTDLLDEVICWSPIWEGLLSIATTAFTSIFVLMSLSSEEQDRFFFYYLGMAVMPGSILIFDVLTMSNPTSEKAPYLSYFSLLCILIQLLLVGLFGPGDWMRVEGGIQGLGSILIGIIAYKLRKKAAVLPRPKLKRLVYRTLPNVFVSGVIAILYFSAEVLPCISKHYLRDSTDIRTCADTSSATFTFSLIFAISVQIAISPPTAVTENYNISTAVKFSYSWRHQAMLICFGFASIMAVFVYASAREDISEGYERFMTYEGFGGFRARFVCNGLARAALGGVMVVFIWDESVEDNKISDREERETGASQRSVGETRVKYSLGEKLRSKLMTRTPGQLAPFYRLFMWSALVCLLIFDIVLWYVGANYRDKLVRGSWITLWIPTNGNQVFRTMVVTCVLAEPGIVMTVFTIFMSKPRAEGNWFNGQVSIARN